MSVDLHFLNWDAPVTTKVREFLLPQELSGPLDLSKDLIVVPTRQAGRRLREALALHCSSRQTALLSLRVVTPAFFLHPEDEAGTVAALLEVAAVWADVLMNADLGRYGGLFPARAPSQDFTWALRTGEMIEGLRSDLADGGYRIGDVYRDFGDVLEEKERWHDLSELESAYRERLGALGLNDPDEWKLRSAESAELPAGVERIVLAAVPDPTPLMVRKLEHLVGQVPIVVLVHAPRELADCFDGWGRPLPAEWRKRRIDIPDPDADIVLSGSPWSQSRRVLEVIARASGRFGPADVALGVPDEGVVPFLEAELSAAGLTPFNPAGRPTMQHPLYQLLQSFRDLQRKGDYASVSAMMRNGDYLEYLQKKHDVSPGLLLEELDRCQNEYLPQSLGDIIRGADISEYRGLAKAAAAVAEQVAIFKDVDVDTSLRSFLQSVYEFRILNARRPEDGEFVAVAVAIDASLRRMSHGAPAEIGIDKESALELLLWSLGRESYYPEAEESVIDLEGWLELPWNDAPFLIVTGMNDGIVPDSRPSDVFLPDALRRQLNLRHDEDRLSRDAYLMTSLIESRREHGRVCFISGKTGASGDVMNPSRLLFRCGDDELPRRAERLFATPSEARAGYPASISFRLQAAPPPDVPTGKLDSEKISVTAFRDYLECPFRYYLKHVLGMEALDDRNMELDATDFGSLVHDALRGMALDDGMRRCDDVVRLREFLCAAAANWVAERFGPSVPLQVEAQLESAKQRLRRAAAVQAKLAKDGWEIVRAEVPIGGEIDGVHVRGRIDRIDRHRESGRIRLLDYKTADKGGAPEEAHLASLPRDRECPGYAVTDVAGKMKRWIDLQLPLYAVMLSRDTELRGPFELGYFNLPKALEDTGVVLWTDPPENLLESARACAEGVIGDIKRRRFWPPAQRVKYDDFEGLFPADAALCIDAEGFRSFIDGGRTA